MLPEVQRLRLEIGPSSRLCVQMRPSCDSAVGNQYHQYQLTDRLERYSTADLESYLTGRLERCPTGRLERRATSRLERCPTGRLERRPTGRLERRATGRLERRPTSRFERRATGRLERCPTGDLHLTGNFEPSPTTSYNPTTLEY